MDKSNVSMRTWIRLYLDVITFSFDTYNNDVYIC